MSYIGLIVNELALFKTGAIGTDRVHPTAITHYTFIPV